MAKLKPSLYHTLVILFIFLGLTFSIIISYNYYSGIFDAHAKQIDLLCSKGGFVDCQKVLNSEYSKFLNVPLSVWGIGFYLISILYFLFPTMNPKSENYLKIPYFFILLISNIVNLALLALSILVIGSLCTQCSVIYIANLALLILLYIYEFRGKNFYGELNNYFSSLFKLEIYQKELAMYGVLTLLLFSLLFFFNNNQILSKEYQKLVFQQATKKDSISDEVKKYKESPLLPIDTKGSPYYGTKGAPIQLVVYHDLQCSHCQRSYFILEKLLAQYKPLVQLSYLNYPFITSPQSLFSSIELAQISLIAHEKGKYHDFAKQFYGKYQKGDYIDKKAIEEIFKAINLPLSYEEIAKQMPGKMPAIKKQIQEAEKEFMANGMQSGVTPTIYLNGRLASAGFTNGEKLLKTLIDREIIKLAKEKYKKNTKSVKLKP